MPKRSPMVDQKGSVLILVIGMAIILTMAATSVILLSEGALNEEYHSTQRMYCFYDADAGLMLGAKWLRIKGRAFITQDWVTNRQDLYSDSPFPNGCAVSVHVDDDDANNLIKTVYSQAVCGSETLKLAWEIGVPPSPPAVDPAAGPQLVLNNWRILP
jgi:hypothetical protein